MLSLVGGGCATGSGSMAHKYTWGKYGDHLYSFYQHPDDSESFFVALSNAIERHEKLYAGNTEYRLAPGLYAEFGYMLVIRGEYDKAVTNFEKEKALWPESAYFMDSMIKNVAGMREKQEGSEGEAVTRGQESGTRGQELGVSGQGSQKSESSNKDG